MVDLLGELGVGVGEEVDLGFEGVDFFLLVGYQLSERSVLGMQSVVLFFKKGIPILNLFFQPAYLFPNPLLINLLLLQLHLLLLKLLPNLSHNKFILLLIDTLHLESTLPVTYHLVFLINYRLEMVSDPLVLGEKILTLLRESVCLE